MDVVKLHEQESRKVAAPTLAAMGSESNFGANNYEEKMQMMDKANDGRITMDNVVELGNVFKKLVTDDGPKKAIETLKAVKSAVTPGFIKRMNNKKIHIKYVEEAEQ